MKKKETFYGFPNSAIRTRAVLEEQLSRRRFLHEGITYNSYRRTNETTEHTLRTSNVCAMFTKLI